MADVVYLHVGAPKTGTTFVQDRLYVNRAGLARHGIHYPVGLHADMFDAALDLIDRPWGGQGDAVRGEWASLTARVRRSGGTAIISHEILAGATQEQVDRAMAGFRGAQIHVVLSARDLARQIPAEWQETIKHRSRKTFRRYLSQLQKQQPDRSGNWFWAAQSVPEVLQRWGRDLPPDRVHLVTVPQPGADREELWRRFCRAFALDPALAPDSAARANASIGIDEIAMLRDLNRRLRKAGMDSVSYRRLVRQIVAHDLLAQRKNMRRVTLPPASWDWVQEITEEWLVWLRSSGVDVIGDLEDLCPSPPDREAKWQNPDKPRGRKVRDAAMDALVATLLEAADRPDPAQTTVARLGRAAKRLRGR